MGLGMCNMGPNPILRLEGCANDARSYNRRYRHSALRDAIKLLAIGAG